MSETATMLALPRPQASASDDSFTALMNAVLDSARSSTSGSLESSGSGSHTTPSTASDGTAASVPSLDAGARTASSSSRSSTTDVSTTPSPCPSILRSSSNLTLPSRTGSPNISFAPLPQIAPRKRNSPHPLGVAARSRLLRHRRMLREHGLNPDDVPYPYGPGSGVMSDPSDNSQWGEEIREAEAGVDAHEDAKAARGHPRTRAMSDPSEGDALVSLGRLMKGAGKTLWRSISMKDVRGKDVAKSSAASELPPPLPDAPPQPEAEEAEKPPQKTEVHLFEDDGTRPPAAEGGVWEEEVEEGSWKELLSKPPASPDSAQSDTTATTTPRSDKTTTPRTSVERIRAPKKRVSTVEIFATHIR